MVTIANVHLREGDKGSFMSLELHGDTEIVQSMNTGRFYATAKRCFISSTFTEQHAKSLIGTKLPGTVVRVESTPYDFTIPETGEVIQLAHSYSYMPPQTQNAEISVSQPLALA